MITSLLHRSWPFANEITYYNIIRLVSIILLYVSWPAPGTSIYRNVRVFYAQLGIHTYYLYVQTTQRFRTRFKRVSKKRLYNILLLLVSVKYYITIERNYVVFLSFCGFIQIEYTQVTIFRIFGPRHSLLYPYNTYPLYNIIVRISTVVHRARTRVHNNIAQYLLFNMATKRRT